MYLSVQTVHSRHTLPEKALKIVIGNNIPEIVIGNNIPGIDDKDHLSKRKIMESRDGNGN